MSFITEEEFWSDIGSYEDALPPGVRLPSIEIDKKYYKQLNIPENVSNFTFLKTMCDRALVERGLNNDIYVKRLEMELGVLEELGFVDYVLLSFDILNFCHLSGIATGEGRGSGAGSLVLYLTNVTKVDPIKYGLIFERFVNKARSKKIEKNGVTYLSGKLLCDVDHDIEQKRRPEVIQYIENKYKGKTSKILTLNTLSTKLCLKEVGKIVGGLSEEAVKALSDMIPKNFGIVASIEESIKQNEKFKQWAADNIEIISVVNKLLGLNKNCGVHPSGIAISYDEIEDIYALKKAKDGDLVSEYNMAQVAEYVVKVDILGLRCLSVVEDVCKNIKINISDINPHDHLIYKYLQDLKTPHGLFQIEARTTLEALKKIKPKNLEQLSAVTAISRPGALQFVDQYADYTNNGSYEAIHPFFDEILKNTGGICLYQEDLLKLLNKVGFDLTESEEARRCIGKKDLEGMKKWQSKIELKVKENKLDPKISSILWRIANDSAKYQFNKCAFELETVQKLDGTVTTLKEVKRGDKIKSYNLKTKVNHYTEVIDIIKGDRELYEVVLEDGKNIRVSLDHKILCEDLVMRPLKEVLLRGYKVITE